MKDGKEDKNFNGKADPGESNPFTFDPRSLPFLPLLLE
jgi:hypothetical protein